MKGFLAGIWVLVSVMCFAQNSYTSASQWQYEQDKRRSEQLQKEASDLQCKINMYEQSQKQSEITAKVQVIQDSIASINQQRALALAKVNYDFDMKIAPLSVRLEVVVKGNSTPQPILEVKYRRCD